ncbi:hypothetical protein CRENBAI_020850 [Crenichthys baileyi]|uniref:Uncharacterized protein n=1 Tax=Crenichthys baileyi TaxID=28760 RepID=A0AAV9SA86_9TELE
MHSSIPQASNLSSSAPSSPWPSTSSQGLPPYQHSAQPPLHPPLQHPAKPNGASGPATSAGCSVADQDPAPVLGPDREKVQDLAEYLVSLRQALYRETSIGVRGAPSAG